MKTNVRIPLCLAVLIAGISLGAASAPRAEPMPASPLLDTEASFGPSCTGCEAVVPSAATASGSSCGSAVAVRITVTSSGAGTCKQVSPCGLTLTACAFLIKVEYQAACQAIVYGDECSVDVPGVLSPPTTGWTTFTERLVRRRCGIEDCGINWGVRCSGCDIAIATGFSVGCQSCHD